MVTMNNVKQFNKSNKLGLHSVYSTDNNLSVMAKAIHDSIMDQVRIGIASLVGGILEKEMDRRIGAFENRLDELIQHGNNKLLEQRDKELKDLRKELVVAISALPAPVFNVPVPTLTLNQPELKPIFNVPVSKIELSFEPFIQKIKLLYRVQSRSLPPQGSANFFTSG